MGKRKHYKNRKIKAYFLCNLLMLLMILPGMIMAAFAGEEDDNKDGDDLSKLAGTYYGTPVLPDIPSVSGLTYEIHTYIASSCTQDDNGMFTGVAGEYRVKNVLVNGEPLEPDRLYTVATLDYTMIDHGDGHTAFDGGKILWESDEYDFELLRDYIADTLGGSVGAEYGDPYGQERIVAVETPD